MPKFKTYNQNQIMLLPPDIRDCIPNDHICFIINDIVDNMNLDCIEDTYSEDGSSAYNPRMLIKLMFYSYLNQTRSSRKIEKMAIENIVQKYLCANSRPDHGTINLFRKKHLKEIEDIFAQIVLLGCGLGIIDPTDLSIDGSVIKANASKKKTFNQEEIKELKKKIKEILKEAEQIDEEENEKYKDRRGYSQMPERLKDPKVRKREIERLKKELKKLDLAQKEITARQKETKDKEEKNLKRNTLSNTTDPDSRLMKLKGGKTYKQAYNGQIATNNQMIVAYQATNENVDTNHLIPLIEKAEKITGKKVKQTKEDSIYFSKYNIEKLKDKNIDAYMPDKMKSLEERQERNNEVPKYDKRNFKYDKDKDEFICPENKRVIFKEMDGERKKYICYDCENCKARSKCVKGKNRHIRVDWQLEEYKLEMRKKLNSEKGKNKYLERLGDVEPVFGNIIYNQGASQFLCRGEPMVNIEFGLSCIAHNLVKISNWINKNKNDKEKEEIKSQLGALMSLRAAG